MRDKSSKNTGPTQGDGETCEHSPLITETNGVSISYAGEIPVRETRLPASQAERVLAVTSSALLMHCGLALFSERIRVISGEMLPGLGGECELAWSRLATLCCPSDSERVALGLSIKGNACSCSVSLPTPVASDWKGGKRKRKKGYQANLRDEFTQTTGWLYLHPEDLEAAMGFPATWSELSGSATRSTPPSPSGSESES